MNQIVQLVLWYWKMILYALIICGAVHIHDIQWSGWMRYLFGNCKDMTGRYDNHMD